ncbi:MAG: hypothetical protein ACNA7Y_04500 [Gammaproteobacteria bacterium]
MRLLILMKESWQQDIITHIEMHQNITSKDASRLWKVTERTAFTRLKKLCDEGVIIEISTSPYDPKKKFVLSR